MRTPGTTAVFVLAVLVSTTTTITTRAVTLDQCKLGVTSSGPVPEKTYSSLSEDEWKACYGLLATDLAAAPKEEMYRVDGRGFPSNLVSTRPEDFAAWGETVGSPAPTAPAYGAFDAFRPSSVVEASSDITFRTAGLSAWSLIDRPLFAGLALDGRLLTGTGTITPASIGDLGGLLPSTALRVPLLPVRIVDPLTYNPHARDWEKSGNVVASCAEWVWKKYYQYSRFEDATKACGNDASCVFDVAFATTTPPGIAYRESNLRRKDGELIGASLKMVHGIEAKNPFFGVSPSFLRDQRAPLVRALQIYDSQILKGSTAGGCINEGPGPFSDACSPWVPFVKGRHKDDTPEQKAVLAGKLAAIDGLLRKKVVYAVGATPLQTAFARLTGDTIAGTYDSEWHWHKALHDAQAALPRPITMAERKAISERTEYLQALMTEYAQLTTFKTCRAPALVQPANPLEKGVGKWRDLFTPGNPIDDLRPKPIDVALKRKAIAAMRGDLLPPQAITGQILAGVAPAFASNEFATPFSLEATPVEMKTMSGNLPGAPVAPLSDVALTDIDTGILAGNLARRAVDTSCTIDLRLAGKHLSAKLEAVIARAQEVQEELVDLLVDEYDRGQDGCLSESGVRCDWAPELFAERVLGKLSEEREQDFGTCLLYTNGDDFTPVGELATVARLPEYFTKQQSAFEAEYQKLPKVGTGGNTAIGESDEGNQGGGSADWFNGGYKYNVAYSIKPLDFSDGRDKSTSVACSFDIQANASFKAGVGILDVVLGPTCGKIADVIDSPGAGELGGVVSTGLDICDAYSRLKNLVDVKANVRTTGETGGSSRVTGTYSADVVLANERVYTVPPKSHTASGAGVDRTLFDIHQVVQPGEFKTAKISSTVVVVVVPVTFQAYGELRMGASFDARATQAIDCGGTTSTPNVSFDAALGFRPFVTAYAVASAGVGVSGLQAGVRGRVALIDAQLPITAEMKLAGGKLAPAIKASFVSDLLSGSMSAFAEVGVGPFRYTAEKELFSWRGWHKEIPIWTFTPTPIPVGALNMDLWPKFQSASIGGGT